ncbi:MAG: FkbM family methyltransferase [Bacteroidota bacterium]
MIFVLIVVQMLVKLQKKLASVGSKVYAFEPNPFAFKVLLQNTAGFSNVTAFNKGVLDRNEMLKLYMHEWSDKDEIEWSEGSSLLEYKGNVLSDKYVEIEVIDLIEFVKSLRKRIRVLKIDIEGVEYEILEKLIEEKIDYIFVETHEKKIPELINKHNQIVKKISDKKIKKINLNWI